MSTAEKTLSSQDPQERLARLEAEVEALRTQLRRAQRLATVGTMTAMVAHEFNNILTPVVNCAQLARVDPALAEKAISRAAENGQQAAEICEAILAFSRGDALQREPVSLPELVSRTLTAMGRDLRKDRIELTLDIPPDLTILSRRVELQQVLLNLLLNARTAVMGRRGAGRIELFARRDDEAVTIRVSDTGVGIPPENLERIFEPFFSGAGDGGHGLGLAVCREIVAAMDGHICVESEVGKGSTFTVRLPA
jgi:signal transduction histidine kinase